MNTPAMYKAQPTLLAIYMGTICVTVSRNWNFNCPSSVNVFHIMLCVKPAQYMGITYRMIPIVPIQKWVPASFFEYSFVFHIFGTSQYKTPKVKKPFHPRAPTCT